MQYTSLKKTVIGLVKVFVVGKKVLFS